MKVSSMLRNLFFTNTEIASFFNYIYIHGLIFHISSISLIDTSNRKPFQKDKNIYLFDNNLLYFYRSRQKYIQG